MCSWLLRPLVIIKRCKTCRRDKTRSPTYMTHAQHYKNLNYKNKRAGWINHIASASLTYSRFLTRVSAQVPLQVFAEHRYGELC